MEPAFEVEVRKNHHGTVLAVSGELDLASSSQLEEQLALAEQAGTQLVIVDLRSVEFIDSTGLGVLIKAHQQAEGSGRRFAVVRGPSQVQRLFGLTGLEDRLTLIDSPDELLGVDA